MRSERRMNPKCHSRAVCDTFSARNADSTGLFLMPITRAASFDHLVGEQLQGVRHLKAERPGRLQVDHQLEFRRLQHRQVGGLGALEHLTGVGADLTIHARTIGAVAHQPAGFDSLARSIARGNPVTRRERHKLDAPAREEDITSDVQGVGAIAHEGGEGRLDLAASFRPLRNAAASGASDDPALTNPTTGIACARTSSGHVKAAPPSAAKNFRRSMWLAM
jgi:hypothetical protein